MTACCGTASTSTFPCRCCSETGPVVGAAPVRRHLSDAGDGSWQYWPTASCPVVFPLDDTTVTDDQLVAQVRDNAVEASRPVCFCFAHTAEALAADLLAHDGTSTIKASIEASVAEGLCVCEDLDPSGSCCLAAVHRTLEAVQAQPPADARARI